MRKMTDELEFKILQHCSDNFLTEGFPNNWEDMKESEQEQFMEDHTWEQMEYTPVETVYENIENAANCMKSFLIANGLVEKK